MCARPEFAFAAIDPAGVTGDDQYLSHCEELFSQITAEPGTRLPSQRRYRNRQVAEERGVQLPTALFQEIQDIIAGVVRTTGRF